MRTSVLAMILAGGEGTRLAPLTDQRAKPAVPFGGKYRIIDFGLSNFVNSGIDSIFVLTQFKSQSLMEHIINGWNISTTQARGHFIIPVPAQMQTQDRTWYRGTADAIYQNLGFLKESHEPYVIIAPGDCVYKMDFNTLLEYHVDKKADITVVCRDMPETADMSRFGTIMMNEEMRVVGFEEKPLQPKTRTISCGIYIIRRRLLIDVIEKCAEEDRYDFVRDVIIRYRDVKRIFGYKIQSYWKNIASVEDYFETNMDFLKPEVRDYFFNQYPNIYSKVDDLPPAKYNPGAHLKNALVSSGCIVNGSVENSILFKSSYIGNNTVIRNSIILNDVYIGDNAVIENCIVESHSTINGGEVHKGEDGRIKVVVEQRERFVM